MPCKRLRKLFLLCGSSDLPSGGVRNGGHPARQTRRGLGYTRRGL